MELLNPSEIENLLGFWPISFPVSFLVKQNPSSNSLKYSRGEATNPRGFPLLALVSTFLTQTLGNYLKIVEIESRDNTSSALEGIERRVSPTSS